MRSLIMIVAFALLGQFGQAQQIVQSESQVNFEIGGIGWSTVEGCIKGMKGSVNWTGNIVNNSFNVCINPSSVFTDNEERDEHLKNEDFFNVSMFSEICFVSSSIIKDGTSYKAIGKLTILGVSKKVSFPFAVAKNNGTIVLTGKLEINRFDYSLAAESYTSTIMVDDMVSVEIICALKN
jgi:polyisoprenoid-binding protein YceI